MLLLSGDRSAERVPDLFAHFIFFWNALHCICSKGSQHFFSAIWKLIIINFPLNCSFWEHIFGGVSNMKILLRNLNSIVNRNLNFSKKLKRFSSLMPLFYSCNHSIMWCGLCWSKKLAYTLKTLQFIYSVVISETCSNYFFYNLFVNSLRKKIEKKSAKCSKLTFVVLLGI